MFWTLEAISFSSNHFCFLKMKHCCPHDSRLISRVLCLSMPFLFFSLTFFSVKLSSPHFQPSRISIHLLSHLKPSFPFFFCYRGCLAPLVSLEQSSQIRGVDVCTQPAHLSRLDSSLCSDGTFLSCPPSTVGFYSFFLGQVLTPLCL